MSTNIRMRSFGAVLVAALLLCVARPVGAHDVVSVTGAFTQWSAGGAELKLDDGLWMGAVELPAGEVELKLTANRSWDTNWGAESGAGPVAIPGRATLVRGDAGNLRVVVKEAGPYLFVFDENASGGPQLAIIEATEGMTAAEFRTSGGGVAQFAAVAIAGSFNQWIPGDFPLAHQGDGQWEGVVRLPMGVVEYKFATNDSWEQSPSFGGWQEDMFPPQQGTARREMANIKLYVPKGGDYVVRFHERTGEFSVTPSAGIVLPDERDMKPHKFESMRLASSARGWEASEENAMVRAIDGHTWTWTGTLEAGELAFKFAADDQWKHTWGMFWGKDAIPAPAKGVAALDAPDIRVTIPEAGAYYVTFNDVFNSWSIAPEVTD